MTRVHLVKLYFEGVMKVQNQIGRLAIMPSSGFITKVLYYWVNGFVISVNTSWSKLEGQIWKYVNQEMTSEPNWWRKRGTLTMTFGAIIVTSDIVIKILSPSERLELCKAISHTYHLVRYTFRAFKRVWLTPSRLHCNIVFYFAS